MHLSPPIFILIGGFVVFIVLSTTRRPRTQSGTPDERDPSNTSFRDDDRYWIGGIIYNNPDDSDLFVPKRYGMGRTVNFGRPLGKALLIGPVLLPLLLIILRDVTHS